MRVYPNCLLILCFFFFVQSSLGQSSFNLSDKKTRKINFKLVNNLIIFPVELNGVKLSFVLDTGVSKPILFNLVNTDSLKINNVETIYLQGLGGEGSVEALKSKKNIFRIGNAVCVNQDVYVVFDSEINFTPRLGVPVHGIIGYDIFKDFIVELNYSSKFIRLHKPEYFRPKKSKRWITLPINLHKSKPYVNAEVKIDKEFIPVKLLMDTGGSDALWLFENENKKIFPADEMYFDDFLGKGLSGSVYGKRSKINNFKIGPHIIDEVNVAYPDSTFLMIAKNYKERNGSLAGNILKRFNFFFDYQNGTITIKRNKNFKSPFFYNNAGIILEQNGSRLVRQKSQSNLRSANYGSKTDGSKIIELSSNYSYVLRPSYQIVELREGSNAKLSGLLLGDIITAINGKSTSNMSLQEVNRYFYDKEGKSISIRVEREGKQVENLFRFKLDNVFKKKSLQTEGSN